MLPRSLNLTCPQWGARDQCAEERRARAIRIAAINVVFVGGVAPAIAWVALLRPGIVRRSP